MKAKLFAAWLLDNPDLEVLITDSMVDIFQEDQVVEIKPDLQTAKSDLTDFHTGKLLVKEGGYFIAIEHLS